jgi:hypothetical protein
MRPIAFGIAAAFFICLLSSDGFATPRIPLTDCETITQRGNYILENDLVLTLGQGNGNCLVINSSHVNVNLNGRSITIDCPAGCYPGEVGNIGIDIMSGADHVSVSNGSVENFGYGVAGAADYISATDLRIRADIGIVLSDVSRSVFKDITVDGVLTEDSDGVFEVLAVNGGGYNTFSSISSGPAFEGTIFANSSHNVIDGFSVSCFAEEVAGPGILLTQYSSNNSIMNSNIFVLFGNGVEVDLDSGHNVIQNNIVEIATTPPGFFALFDQNPDCGSDIWIDNTFSNIFAPDQVSASPANCID